MEVLWGLIPEMGAGTIVVIFVIAILTGRLVPSTVLHEVKEDRDQWRETALKRESTLAAAVEAVKETHAATQLLLDMVSELQNLATRSVEDGGDDEPA